jgi:site-specific DNA-methyltransferase (adenine-specific)
MSAARTKDTSSARAVNGAPTTNHPTGASSSVRLHFIAGDCLHAAEAKDAWHLPSPRLVYLDPPFFVGSDFRARARGRTRSHGDVAFLDAWPSFEAYLAWLDARLAVAWQVCRDDGSLWLHLDYRAVHHAKVLADARFGPTAFQGEIIWVPGNGGKGSGLSVTHQTILVFAKNPKRFLWQKRDPVLREPYAATSLNMHFTHIDETGRRYRERVIAGKAYRYYADEGRALGSVWNDCGAMLANTPLRKEATGYPTQKPIKLLDRIIRATTEPGDWVWDLCAGSGTTLHAAHLAGRSTVGFDIGQLSRETIRARLSGLGLVETALRINA